jgi:hypothetical protein
MSDQVDGVQTPIDGVESGKEIKEDKAFLAVKAEKKALAEKYANAQAELNKFKEDARLKQEESLKQQGEYQKLYEASLKEKEEISLKLLQKEKRELALRKIDVVMQELGAPLAKPEYWDFVDLDRIPVDEATKDIDKNIAKQVASDFMMKFPELMQKKAGKMPNEAAGTHAKITKEEWNKLPLKEKKERLKDVLPNKK